MHSCQARHLAEEKEKKGSDFCGENRKAGLSFSGVMRTSFSCGVKLGMANRVTGSTLGLSRLQGHTWGTRQTSCAWLVELMLHVERAVSGKLLPLHSFLVFPLAARRCVREREFT